MERTGRENAPKVGRIEDIDGLDKFGDWLAYNLGSGTASIGTMVAGGGLGGLAVKGLAKGALVNAGKAIGAGSMGFAPNYGESLNNAYEEAGEIENQAAFAAANSANTYFFLLLLPALDRAIAIACFWGLPLFISVLMLAEIVLLDLPLLSGILFLSYWFTVRCYL